MWRLSSTWISLGLLVLMLVVLAPNNAMDDNTSKYCEISQGGCCNNREDGCSVRISDTLCYCDEFCDRSEGGDCCPDYKSYCNVPNSIGPTCMHHGQRFSMNDGPISDNCNTCRCDMNGNLHCRSELCILDDDLIHNVNYKTRHSPIGWEAYNYTEFWGRKFADGLRMRLGTFEPSEKVKNQTKMESRAKHELPLHFNAAKKWGTKISPVRDQKWCGSSWAVSTASVASDRFAVQLQRNETLVLSPQQILSCMQRQQGCNGGHLGSAWKYLRNVGIVDEKCFPYIEGTNGCIVSNKHGRTLLSVENGRKKNGTCQSLYKMGPAYALSKVKDIMYEIQRTGPVQATMRVYRDFFSYRRGIYQRTSASHSDPTGFHSVRLMGWGQKIVGGSVTKYWIAANSWGTWWGEDGYFRILRGQNECEIESYVLSSLAHVKTKLKTAVRGSRKANIRGNLT